PLGWTRELCRIQRRYHDDDAQSCPGGGAGADPRQCHCSGTIRTSINRRAWETQAALKRLLTLFPYGRIGEPADIGRAVVGLASDEADYVVGRTLYVDGGMTLYPGFGTKLTGGSRARRGGTPRHKSEALAIATDEDAGSLRAHSEETRDLPRRCLDLDHDRLLN